jgi:hypothetical protein
MKTKNYPDWEFETKQKWLRNVRKNWSSFGKSFNHHEMMCGSAYYPEEVYQWLNEFDKMDKKMKEYYRNA